MFTYFSTCGLLFRKPCPSTPQQNGVVKRKHHHIREIVRTIHVQCCLPPKFWVDAVYYAVYTINRLPTPLLQGLSSFEKLFHSALDYNFLKVFRCKCVPYLSSRLTNKLMTHPIHCIFLGYASNYKSYRCLDLKV